MEIRIRKFIEEDIPYKVKWINDDKINQFLHYTLPLKVDETIIWFQNSKKKTDRADYTIICDDEPVGLIGLLNIDNRNRKAEYYITLGGGKYQGLGIAKKASELLINNSRYNYNLNKIYLYTEVENISAQKLFERIGFNKEGLLKEDLIQNGKKIDRLIYGLFLDEYFTKER